MATLEQTMKDAIASLKSFIITRPSWPGTKYLMLSDKITMPVVNSDNTDILSNVNTGMVLLVREKEGITEFMPSDEELKGDDWVFVNYKNSEFSYNINAYQDFTKYTGLTYMKAVNCAKVGRVIGNTDWDNGETDRSKKKLIIYLKDHTVLSKEALNPLQVICFGLDFDGTEPVIVNGNFAVWNPSTKELSPWNPSTDDRNSENYYIEY